MAGPCGNLTRLPRLRDDGDHELWAKPLEAIDSGQVAVALLNRSGQTATLSFSLNEVGIDATVKHNIRDLWTHQDLTLSSPDELSFSVPSHGVVVLKITGKATQDSPF